MNNALVSLPELLQSIRHAGYLSPAHAVAELVDNAVQASASSVEVCVHADEAGGVALEVRDDGHGISPEVLPRALALGGSTRFDDRAGLGRFGVGLPCSSLSQARRVEVTSWVRGGDAWRCGLDLDEVRAGSIGLEALLAERPRGAPPSGTVVSWSRADQLSSHPLRRLVRDLQGTLGRIFRRFIWGGLRLTVNGASCPPSDPTLLDRRAPWSGAALLCPPTELDVQTALGAGRVRVTFTELPVAEWHALSNAEKRTRGITKGAGISVLRAEREVDHGWLFMGDKRREAYDDWWRCELEVSPALDEAMGLTFTKQQVRPCPELIDALTPIIAPTAHALNGRVRRAHRTLASRVRFSGTEARARAVEARMPALPAPAPAPPAPPPLLVQLAAQQPDLLIPSTEPEIRVVEDDLGPAPLIEVLRWGGRLIVAWNRAHPFYERAYAPLAASDEPGAAERRGHLELLMVALARAEAAAPEAGAALAAHRRRWADALAELLRG